MFCLHEATWMPKLSQELRTFVYNQTYNAGQSQSREIQPRKTQPTQNLGKRSNEGFGIDGNKTVKLRAIVLASDAIY